MVEIIKKILRITLILIFLICIGIIAKILVFDPYVSNKTIDEVKRVYYDENTSEESKISSLTGINPDICGWIKISGTRIDYPVLQANSDDPKYYLNHNYKREETKYGSIFADKNSKVKSNPKNTILYGHHMADGQMFADLMKFSDVDFYKKNPIINYNTVLEKEVWKIISVFKTNTLPEQGKVFDYVVSKFSDEKSFLEYVNEVKKRSLINIPVDIDKNDRLITLSTCSYEFENFRTVVVARKVRKNESANVDVSAVSKAENPLMPDCWYKKYGGSPPS